MDEPILYVCDPVFRALKSSVKSFAISIKEALIFYLHVVNGEVLRRLVGDVKLDVVSGIILFDLHEPELIRVLRERHRA